MSWTSILFRIRAENFHVLFTFQYLPQLSPLHTHRLRVDYLPQIRDPLQVSYDTLRRQFLSYKAHHRQVTLKCVQQLKLHICTDIPNKRLIRKHTMIHSVQILKNLVPTTTTYSVTVFLLLLLLFLKLYSKTEVIICQSNLKKEKEKKPFIKTPGRGISAFHNLYFSFLPQHLCTIIALNRQIFISQNREF